MSNKIYKCIKNYPEGPKIGATAVEGSIGYRTLENGVYNKKDVENYPEFWEEIIKKDWIANTVDGVKVYKADECYYILEDFNIKHGPCFDNILRQTNYIFSTEKAARDWVELNRPKYSLQDIKNAIQTQCGKWTITTEGDLALIDLKRFK